MVNFKSKPLENQQGGENDITGPITCRHKATL